jgi:glycosyltransferase involved in cell wall biosynthesis
LNLGWTIVGDQNDDLKTSIAIETFQIEPGISGGVETYLSMLLHSFSLSKYNPIILCHPINSATFVKHYKDVATIATIKFSVPLRILMMISRSRPKLTILARDSVSFSKIEENLGVSMLHSPVQIFTAFDFQVPAILNLHDMQHKYFPENFSSGDLEARDYYYKLSADAADKIIVSSEYVAHDVHTFLEVEKEKIQVIAVAWNKDFHDALLEPTKPANCPENQFFFYPAQFWPHKNHKLLVELFAKNRKYFNSLKLNLVFTGGLDTKKIEEMNKLIRSFKLEGVVHILGYASNQELAWLYQNSLATVIPTLFEASSYPIIEAQLAGSFVIAARTTSLPELVRDGSGVTFDPNSLDDLESSIYKLLEGKYDLSKIRESALRRVRLENSEANFASNLNNLYSDLMHTRGLST